MEIEEIKVIKDLLDDYLFKILYIHISLIPRSPFLIHFIVIA